MTPTILLALVLAADPMDAIPDPGERAAVAAIAARFAEGPTAGREGKATVLKFAKLKATGKGVGAVKFNDAGRVVGVTADQGDFTNDDYKLFAAFSDLEAITLWHNFSIARPKLPVEGTGEGLSHVAGLAKLTRLTLAGGWFNDVGMRAAAKLPHLTELHAWHARFTDAGVEAFRGHPTLEVIKVGPMWANDLTDKTLATLGTCPKLRHVKFTETYLTWDAGLSHLVARKATLKQIELGNALIEPADVDRLKAALPDAKVTWDGLAAAGKELAGGWNRGKAKWMPATLVERAVAASRAE